MPEFFVLVNAYGLPFLGLVTALSCLGLPVPVSIAMMIGGSLAASGDLDLGAVTLVAFLSALTGDQVGFWIGRVGGGAALRWLSASPMRAKVIDEARSYAHRRGWIGVFLTRWLLSPLGPYVNLVMGATGARWTLFSSASAAGELVWVVLYVGLGYVFSSNVTAASELAGNMSGFLAAAAIAIFLGWRIWRVLFKTKERL